MNSEAYKKWSEMFDDDMSKIWKKQRKELQKVTVLLFAFQRELKVVQTKVEVDLFSLQKQLKYKDDLEKRVKVFSEKSQRKKSSPINKENNLVKQLGEVGAMNVKKPSQIESPDLFGNIDLNVQTNSSSEISVIDLSVSEDETTKTNTSPTIKRRRKRYKLISNPAAYLSENNTKSTITISTVPESTKISLFKSPVPKSYHDMSVIECTPEITALRCKTNGRIGDFVSKKKSKKKSNNTLTQMLRLSSNRKSNASTKNPEDSDETYFEDNIDETKMGITDLLEYINKSDNKKQENISINQGGNDSIYMEMETSSQEVDQFSRGGIFNEEDLETSSEKPEIVHIEAEPVVRGNARKQLHGWSCQQCKNFYSHMKLTPEELQKKMDECSRHRYKYAPPEETMPGFWELSIPPEKD